MRKKAHLIGIIILAINFANLFSQGYDWRFDKEAVINGAKKITRKSKPCHGKKLLWTVLEEYYNDGKLASQKNYYKDELRSEYRYYYDKSGFDSLFIQTYSSNRPNDTLTIKIDIKTNKNKQITEYVSNNLNSGTAKRFFDFKYLEYGNRNKVVSYRTSDAKGLERYKYVYVDRKREYLIYRVDASNVVISKTRYKLDKNGQKKQLLITSYTKTDREQQEGESFEDFINQKDLEQVYQIRNSTSKWKYKYDSKGNWVKKYGKHGLFYKVEDKRKIEY